MATHLFDHDTNFQVYSSGAPIFNEGDKANVMFAVQKGTVDIVLRGRVLETVGPGGLFGEMALIENSPRVASAVATSETRVVPITRDRFLFLVQQTPFFALQLMTVMSERLRRMDERLTAEAK